MLTLITGTIGYIAIAIGIFLISYSIAQAKYQRIKSILMVDFEEWYERKYGSRYIAYAVLWPVVLLGLVVLGPIYFIMNLIK